MRPTPRPYARQALLGLLGLGTLLTTACSSDLAPSAADPLSTTTAPLTGTDAAWVVTIDPSAPNQRLPKELLGQYDLSGALFHYDETNLGPAMGPYSSLAASLPGNVWSGVGFTEWRVGVGLALPGQLLLPTLTDGTPCAASPLYPPQAFAAPGATDLDVIRSRDWFVDNYGIPVREADTLFDWRYDLRYVRSVIDTATRMGVKPLVNIDTMPRALAANRTPRRDLRTVADACEWPLTNRVTNARPANADVFAAAATGLVKRIVEGSGGEAPRPVTHFEVWNEPEMPYFWDKSFEAGPGRLDVFFDMAVRTLVRLDAYRTTSPSPYARPLRFGLGSFAFAGTAAMAISAFDAAAQTGPKVPVDFISFHSYDNDPAKIVADIRQVAAARAASTRYRDVELVLAEWGPSLTDVAGRSMTNMDFPLLVSSVLSLGAAAGLGRAHQSLFWDYYGFLPYGLLDHDLRPRHLYWTYALLARTFHGTFGIGANRIPLVGNPTGELDGGLASVLVSRDAANKMRALFTNRGTTPRTARLDVGGVSRLPSLVLSMSAPGLVPREQPRTTVVTVPARSIVLVEL